MAVVDLSFRRERDFSFSLQSIWGEVVIMYLTLADLLLLLTLLIAFADYIRREK